MLTIGLEHNGRGFLSVHIIAVIDDGHAACGPILQIDGNRGYCAMDYCLIR